MNFKSIKNSINPIWEYKIIRDWGFQLKDIFKEDVLVIEQASYNMKNIAEQMKKISISDMMGYIKLKTIEFLATFLQERFIKNQIQNPENIVVKAKDIILKDIQNQPPVKELSSKLNMSLYKLQ